MAFLNRISKTNLNLREWLMSEGLQKTNGMRTLNQILFINFWNVRYQQISESVFTKWLYQIRCVAMAKQIAKACFRCGEEGHDSHKEQKCKNCKGDHMTSSKQCSIWIKEKEIKKMLKQIKT